MRITVSEEQLVFLAGLLRHKTGPYPRSDVVLELEEIVSKASGIPEGPFDSEVHDEKGGVLLWPGEGRRTLRIKKGTLAWRAYEAMGH